MPSSVPSSVPPTSSSVPFHLAFPVLDLASTRTFYAQSLGCPVGREAERWIDFDFFGHQISAHLVDAMPSLPRTNAVDGDSVPTTHFGAVLSMGAWELLAERLRAAGVPFLLPPRVRFAGLPGEQGTFFVLDPSGNALEFKAFGDLASLFARE